MHVDITLPITINSKQLRVRSLCVIQDFRFLSSFPFKKKQNRKFSVLKENFKIRKSSEYPRLYVHRIRLIILLIHFFIAGQAESALEKLKTEYVCGWLSEVMKTHYEVFISCLLPHPADYVRVGGHWCD